SMHTYSTAVVNNPQIEVFNFHEGHVKELTDFVFPNFTNAEIKSKYYERFSVIEFFKKSEYTPRIFYYQNDKHKVDIDNHFNPFKKGLEINNIPDRKITYVLYNNLRLGHDPLPKELTVANINHILNTIDLRY